MLSPECGDLLGSTPARPPRRSLTVEQNRAGLEAQAARFGDMAADVEVTDTVVGGVTVRIYSPRGVEDPLGVCVYAHGGGWVLGSLDTHHTLCSRISAQGRCVVVSVDYRQPPEFPYPAALDDVVAVLRAISAGELACVDPARLAVAGDSAGGQLAAAAALTLLGEIALKCAILVLPVLDNRPGLYPSYTVFAEGFSLSAEDMFWYFEHFAGPQWADRDDEFLAPMRRPDLRGFPPTVVLTAECDPLRDEGEAFARRLVEAGTPVWSVRFLGAFHPFVLFPELAAARRSVECIANALRTAIGPELAPNRNQTEKR